MKNFEFQTVPKIIFENGAIKRLGEIVQTEFKARNILIVTDTGIIGAGLLEPVTAALDAAKLNYSVYDQIKPDPSEAIILDVAAKAKRNTYGEIDLIIGYGGGSSMDAAKLAAILAKEEQKLSNMYGVGMVTSSRKKMMMIPTTAGTGSEVTSVSIVTTGETTKSGVVSPVLFADLALLDPELTLGLPAPITAATGVDAMVHAIEAFTSIHKKNAISDNLARQAMALLYHNLPTAVADGSNLEARGACLLGAMLAGQAFANAPVAAVHALAYPLGGIFHIPHGVSNAMVLPHVLKFNRTAADKEYAEIGRAIGATDTDDFIRKMEDLCAKVGVNKTLRDLNISNDDIPRLAEDAMLQTRLLQNNPRTVSYDDAVAIYTAAY